MIWHQLWLQVIITSAAVTTHSQQSSQLKNHDAPTMGFGWGCVRVCFYCSWQPTAWKEWLRVIAVQLLAFVHVCVCGDMCLLVSGVRLANTLSSSCGYYAHIQSIWHNHRSHLLSYLSLGNLRAQTTVFWVCECVWVACMCVSSMRGNQICSLQSDRDVIELAVCCCGCQWRSIVDRRG